MKYIIGGGLSGLIFKYFHPEFTIITPETGGMAKNSYMVWIHDTPETRELFGKLSLPIIATKSYIGYFVDGWISESLYPEVNLDIIQKKMSKWNDPIDRTFSPPSLTMSIAADQVNYMNTLDVDMENLINALAHHNIDPICGKVASISPTELTLADGQVLPYTELISTLPAPIFWKSFGQPKKFEATPITNFITSVRPKYFHDKFSMVYFGSTLDVPYSRISHLHSKYAYEVTGEMTKEVFNAMTGIEQVDTFTTPFGRLKPNGENVPPLSNITFLGRFAQWKYGITSEHTIKTSIEYGKEIGHNVTANAEGYQTLYQE